ncbi:MAG: hypothetical protein ABI925_07580 [Verrucomicrobiota bacterium]
MKAAPLSRQQQVLLKCAPISEELINDRSMRAAVFRAKGTDEFANQQGFDRALAALVQTIPIPSEVPEWFEGLAAAAPKWGWKKAIRNPAVGAVGIAFLVIAGVFIFQFIDHLRDFPGIGSARKLLAAASSTRSVLLEPVSADAGTLGDLFFMKHQLQHYDVPPEFADFRAIGWRVFDDEDGRRVAQIWIVEKKIQLFLFPAEKDPKTGAVREFSGWRYVEQEGWAGAVRERNGVCFMAVLRGQGKDLAPYVSKPKE